MRNLQELADFRFRLRTFLSFSEKASEAVGITMQQYQMLQVIEVSGGGGCSISRLAERLLLRHNSAVELVDRGERIGLVRRTEDQADLRRSMLEITEYGRNVLNQLVAEHVQYLEEAGPDLIQSLTTLLNSGTPGQASDAASE